MCVMHRFRFNTVTRERHAFLFLYRAYFFRNLKRRSHMPRLMSRAALVSLVAMLVASVETPTAPQVVPDDALLAPGQSAPGLVVPPANPRSLIGQRLTRTVTSANGSAINKKAVWTSSDTSIAIVGSTGTSTARVTGRRAGTVTITAVS